MSKKEHEYEVGDLVEFIGFTGEEAPDNAELLEEGQTYTISSVNPGDDDNESSYMLQVANPDFDDSKRKSKKNAEFIEVDVFADEIAPAEAEEGEEEEEGVLSPDDVAKGDYVVVVTSEDEEFEGEVVKKSKKSVTLDVDGEQETFDISDITFYEAEAPEAEEEEEEEEEEKPAAKKKAAKKAAPAKKEKAPAKGKKEKAPAKTKAKTKAKDEEEEEEEYDPSTDKELRDIVILKEGEEDEEVLALIADADDICELAQEMSQESAVADYRLGGVLYHMRLTKAYKDIDPAYAERGGFMAYVEQHLSIGYRKAMYLIDIYAKWNKYGLPPEKVAEIGWTKAQVIAGAMDGKGVAKKLLKMAEKNTVEDLKETVKETYGTKPGTSGEREVVKRTTFKFRFLEETGTVMREYMESAKESLGVETDEEVMEHIVTEWAQEHLDVSTTRGKGKGGKKGGKKR